MKRKTKKNYKRLSRFDRSLIFGIIISSLKHNIELGLTRVMIHDYVENSKDYNDLVKNLGFLNSEILKKQRESLIDNNLGKLIKSGIININKDKKYFLTTHGEEIWVKYNKDWFSMPPLNKQFITHD
tara:strand:+ start:844 stop:1224 length:381 start_codon:yes stop_codon:yes gene_type:complete